MHPGAKDRWQHQKLEEAGRTVPYSFQRERGPADTSILDLQPPELSHMSVVLCLALRALLGSPRK